MVQHDVYTIVEIVLMEDLLPNAPKLFQWAFFVCLFLFVFVQVFSDRYSVKTDILILVCYND